jgi:hypothetical protein
VVVREQDDSEPNFKSARFEFLDDGAAFIRLLAKDNGLQADRVEKTRDCLKRALIVAMHDEHLCPIFRDRTLQPLLWTARPAPAEPAGSSRVPVPGWRRLVIPQAMEKAVSSGSRPSVAQRSS